MCSSKVNHKAIRESILPGHNYNTNLHKVSVYPQKWRGPKIEKSPSPNPLICHSKVICWKSWLLDWCNLPRRHEMAKKYFKSKKIINNITFHEGPLEFLSNPPSNLGGTSIILEGSKFEDFWCHIEKSMFHIIVSSWKLMSSHFMV